MSINTVPGHCFECRDWVNTFSGWIATCSDGNRHIICNRCHDKRIDKAIKALEQEPCEDVMTIHTQGLDEGIRCAMCTNSMKSNRGCDGGCVVNENMYREVMNTIRNHIVPPVTPTQKWIPVSERLPEEMGTYMTTLDYGKHGLATGTRYYHGKYFKWMNECVIAWMPLPEPYKAGM